MTITEKVNGARLASWWRSEGDSALCLLCPRRCLIPPGGLGFCSARANISGSLVSLSYGQVCVTAVDPVEKKPVFHYRPGSRLLSVGTFGCNLDCGFCQNAVLARSDNSGTPSKYMSPEELVGLALEKGVDGIGWTFNDPIVWSEYIIDVSRLARGRGIFSLLNTNGYIEPGAREDLLENVDVVKVDIKGFDDRLYRELCQAELGPVKETCYRIMEKGIHLELAYPLIPGRTDDPEMLSDFAEWVVGELGPNVPVHLFRFQPAYRLQDLRSPEVPEMHTAKDILSRTGIRFVYLGGMTGEDEDTHCPSCGTVVVTRRSQEPVEKIFVKKEQVSRFCPTFSNVENLTVGGCCPVCGESLPIRGN